MKIKKRSKKTIYAITSLLLVAIIAIGALVLYINRDSQDPKDSIRKDSETSKSSKKDNPSKQKIDPTPDKDETSTEQPQPNKTPSVASNDKGYVETPISNPPQNNDPYPIRNEHYKIDQQSQNSYHITLYPIVNNPDYSDYNSQLKAYKNESLSYLKQRYGDISNFKFEWSPQDAKNL